MATRYVTLKDSNGDTIYPQISTDSITNNSVTSAKIDWTSIQSVNINKVSGNISWDGYTYCKRFGNIIFVNLNIATSNTIAGSSVLYSGLPVPPSVVCFTIGGSDYNAYRVTINTNGEMCADGDIAGGTWFDGQAIYFV